MTGPGRRTVVAFHAHPDDEALLTGGTLARLSAQGHRVVVVTATRGERGLAGGADGTGESLGRRRMDELRASARALGCARVVWLGYGDSGVGGDTVDPSDLVDADDLVDPDEPADPSAFALAGVAEAATRLAEVLVEERADVLTVYDRNGGYGHPDHVQVHRVGMAAARAAGTAVVLQATAPAGPFRAVTSLLALLGRRWGVPPVAPREVFTDRREITHRVDVRRQLAQKRRAMAAHATQGRGADGPRLLTAVLRLPLPLFGVVFGREWFVEVGAPAGAPRRTDVLDGLHGDRTARGERGGLCG